MNKKNEKGNTEKLAITVEDIFQHFHKALQKIV